MRDAKGKFTRRRFISSGAGYLAAAGLTTVAPGLVRAETPAEKKSTDGPPIVRTLGRTGLKMPIISMGAGAANSPELVAACWEAGMRHFDTAAVYAYGRNEQMVGKALNKMGVRDKAIIATKILTSDQRDGTSDADMKGKAAKELDGCLTRLGTDYIDILYVHSLGGPGVANKQSIMDAMSELKASGKARFIGTTTHQDMATVINETVAAKVWDVVLTSVNFTMANNTALLGAIKKASEAGVGIVAMKTQAGGARFPNPETMQKYSAQTINRAALKWAMANEYVTTAITGISNHDHLRENFLVGRDLTMADEEAKFLADNAITLGFGFCQQCQSCLATCPQDTNIPKLMRTHMYAHQYADLRKARRVYNQIPTTRSLAACTDCESCVASCANSVNIPQRIEDLSLVFG